MKNVKNRTFRCLANPNCVGLLYLGGDGLSREEFVDENGKLSCKISRSVLEITSLQVCLKLTDLV